jgi:hypothetical protein
MHGLPSGANMKPRNNATIRLSRHVTSHLLPAACRGGGGGTKLTGVQH